MIPFNKPYITGRELDHIAQAHANGHLAGDGNFTKHCSRWLEARTGAGKALLTHSCTAALEMAALLADIEPGDDVIMPSYTFVSTANAFVLRGAVPVFVDIRPATLNIAETLIEAAITPRTKAIVPVHYAGVGCEMDAIMAIANKHNLLVIEDAAQAVMAHYKGRPLGAIGHMGALSFHETKNIISGEGGALLCRDARFAERSEIVREKGTNRSRFFRGQVDKYTWVDVGSSFLPGEITAAFLEVGTRPEVRELERVLQQMLLVGQDLARRHQRGQGERRRGVAADRLEHDLRRTYADLAQLFGDDEAVLFVGNDQRARVDLAAGEILQPQRGLLQQRALAGERQELLGIALARGRPQTRAGDAGENHALDRHEGDRPWSEGLPRAIVRALSARGRRQIKISRSMRATPSAPPA